MHRMILLAATALSALATPAALAESGFDFDHTPGRLPKTVVPELYHIDLITDVQKLTLAGHEVITVTVREPVTSITMNQIGLKLGSAVLGSGEAAKISNDDKAQTVALQFDKPIPAGSHKLTIDYTGTIPNTPAGIYYTDYKTPAGRQKRMLVTQFEATDARRMFPGWDEPAFKAKFELSAVLPQDFVPLSNMPVTGTTPAGAGLKKVQFATSPRMSTYLLALVAGDMAAVRSKAGATDIAVWSPTGEYIAYTKIAGGRFAIGVIHPDGTGERTLVESYHAEGPTWAPNGRVLMFFREGSSGDGRGRTASLYTVNLFGGNERRVITPVDASDPAWSPLLP